MGVQPLMKKTLAVLLVVAVSACASPAATPGEECVEPPAGEVEPDSEFDVSVEPNPVAAGGTATLSADLAGEFSDYTGGLAAAWECWNGTEWAQTHVLVRAFDGNEPDVIDLSTDPTVAIPDIGLVIPHSHEITIPDVAPGMYRVTDQLFGAGESLNGHVIVEVEA